MFESTTGNKKWNVSFYEYSARDITEETPYGKFFFICSVIISAIRHFNKFAILYILNPPFRGINKKMELI